jgi:hypothetical protein
MLNSDQQRIITKVRSKMTKESRGDLFCGYMITLLLHILLVSTTSTVAFSPMTASQTNPRQCLHSTKGKNYSKVTLQATTTSDGIADIADIEEITNFATDNGIVLSFTTFGPGEIDRAEFAGL